MASPPSDPSLVVIPATTNKDTQAFRIASVLMKLLNDESVPDALWWLDDQTFAADPKHFQSQVLDPFFRGTKYASFLRTMHKMGFARLSRRFDLPKGVVAYSCELFVKEKPELMQQIRMCNSGKQAQALRQQMAEARRMAPASPVTKKTEASPPGSPLSLNGKKPDPPTSGGSQKSEKKTVSPQVAARAIAGAGDSLPPLDYALKQQMMLRDQAAMSMQMELNSQRMFIQRQHLLEQEQLRRGMFMQPNPYGAMTGAGFAPSLPMPPPSYAELALLQEQLALDRLAGRR